MYSERSNGSGSAGPARRRGGNADRPTGARKRGEPTANSPFILYVEGPGDCDILRSWARRVSRSLEAVVADACVILGGRQPARAVEHFRRARDANSATRGLCILDRDHGAQSIDFMEDGLEFFTWPQRHIESYLLVPEAIRRHARSNRDASFIEELVESLRSAYENGARPSRVGVDAKRLLGPRGPLSRELGCPISPAGVARAMRGDEIHAEVHALFDRVREAAGLRGRVEPVVVHRVERESPVGDEGS